MKKKEQASGGSAPSRFSGMFEDAAGEGDSPPIGAPEELQVSVPGDGKRKGKFSGPEFGQYSIHLLRAVHAEFKGECAKAGLDMSEVVGERVVAWLRERGVEIKG